MDHELPKGSEYVLDPPSDLVPLLKRRQVMLYQLFRRDPPDNKYVAHLYFPWPHEPGQNFNAVMRVGKSKREAIMLALGEEDDEWKGL